MEKIKITIIRAGSSYTPELVERLVDLKEELPVAELAFMDIDEQRLQIMTGFCRRLLARLKAEISITATTDRRRALDGARYVITQIRVGRNAQRVLDEKIPLKYGVIGQETTGPGGMFKALRTIPVMLDIARQVEEVVPQAWIINYANPTGMLAEAVNKYTRANMVGLCSGGLFPRYMVSNALRVTPRSVYYDYFGLNHLNFAYNLRVDGKLISDEEFDQVVDQSLGDTPDAELCKILRLIPIGYLGYYFFRSRAVKQARSKEHTRGEVVQELEKEVFAAYADPIQDTKPAALAKRGGGGYSEVALGVISAIYNNSANIHIVNVPQRGAVPGFPPDAAFEMPCVVNSSGIFPLHQSEIPKTIWGLVAAVKNYEQLAIEAAVTGNQQTALLALLAHPLVGDYELATPLLAEMLTANRQYLPQFFPT